jgi:hypothetical protein
MNCLSTNQDPEIANGAIRSVPVGAEKGNQYDSFRETVDLCEDCTEALVLGKFVKLAERNRKARTITVITDEQ